MILGANCYSLTMTSLLDRGIIHSLCRCLLINLVMAQKDLPRQVSYRQALTVVTLLCCAQLQGPVCLQEPAPQVHPGVDITKIKQNKQ